MVRKFSGGENKSRSSKAECCLQCRGRWTAVCWGQRQDGGVGGGSYGKEEPVPLGMGMGMGGVVGP